MSEESNKRMRLRVKSQRTVFPYAYLLQAGQHTLKNGIAQEVDSFYDWMAANVFAAFSLEAYLNHLGSQRFQCWDEVERLSVEAKISLLLENLGQRPDLSSRPFQTIKDMLRFRNQVAHGKTERIEKESIQNLSPGESPHHPDPQSQQTQWEDSCTRVNAERFLEDAAAVIKQLHEWAGLDTTLLSSLSEGSASAGPDADPFSAPSLSVDAVPPHD